MKKMVAVLIIRGLLGLLTVVLFSCKEDENLGPAPVIFSFYPGSGLIGTGVIVIGNHFMPPVAPEEGQGPHTNNSTVAFNGNIALPVPLYQDSIGKQRIQPLVPEGATSGKITVTANGQTALSTEDFIVTVPSYLPNVTVSTISDYGGIDLDIDKDGNLYVADNNYREIFKISLDGTKTMLLSSLDEPLLGHPMGIAVDHEDNVYATVGNSIMKISPDDTVIVLAGSVGADSGYADGQGAEAKFNIPWGITVDTNGVLYVADFLNNKIRKITPDGTVSTLAGTTSGSVDGPANMAQFASPIGVKVDLEGNVLVCESSKIRKVTPDGVVTTVAGSTHGYLDGPVAEAKFNNPRSITIDNQGNLYVTDSDNFVIRMISPDGMVATVAGSTFGTDDGPGIDAKFCQTKGITIDANGAFFLTQGGGCGHIRKIEIGN